MALSKNDVKNKPRTFYPGQYLTERSSKVYPSIPTARLQNIREKVLGKKVLVMGLGLLGGGLGTTIWLLKNKARVTVTDLKSENALSKTISKVWKDFPKTKFVLGRHQPADFKNNDIIVVNPAVPQNSPFLKIAKINKRRLENEASLFLRYSASPLIGITGTRGKTTTTNWIGHLLKGEYAKTIVTGNSAKRTMMMELERTTPDTPAIVEFSSWHLELAPQAKKGVEVALITNIYKDHLNRYGSFLDYIKAKANIFLTQKPGQKVILNKDNKETKTLLALLPKNRVKDVYYFSGKKLAKNLNGIFYDKGHIFIQDGGRREKVYAAKRFLIERGEHNLMNLLASLLGVYLFLGGINQRILDRIASLPQIAGRQEIIHKDGRLTIVNDTCATSPDGVMAAIKRFKNLDLILITGGTDKNLEYAELSKLIEKELAPCNLVLLESSGTKKLAHFLEKNKFPKKYLAFRENLTECVSSALTIASKYKNSVIVFSPGGASFEKFKNEFDRGRQFNKIVKSLLTK